MYRLLQSCVNRQIKVSQTKEVMGVVPLSQLKHHISYIFDGEKQSTKQLVQVELLIVRFVTCSCLKNSKEA